MVPILCVAVLAVALVVVVVLDRRQIGYLLTKLDEEREKSNCLSAIAADLANEQPFDETLSDAEFSIPHRKSFATHAGEAG